MQKEGLYPRAAIHRVSRVRARACPSKDHLNALKDFEWALKADGAVLANGENDSDDEE